MVSVATEQWNGGGLAGFDGDILNSSNGQYSNMSLGNNSNGTNITIPTDGVNRNFSGKEIIFFLCCTIGVGGEIDISMELLHQCTELNYVSVMLFLKFTQYSGM